MLKKKKKRSGQAGGITLGQESPKFKAGLGNLARETQGNMAQSHFSRSFLRGVERDEKELEQVISVVSG